MIINDHQAEITKQKIEELTQALQKLESEKEITEPAKYTLGHDAFESVIEELKEEVRMYNSLKSGEFTHAHLKSLEDIPKVLIAARISQKVSYEELAKILYMADDGARRIEEFEHKEYENASWIDIVEVAMALKVKFDISNITIENPEPV